MRDVERRGVYIYVSFATHFPWLFCFTSILKSFYFLFFIFIFLERFRISRQCFVTKQLEELILLLNIVEDFPDWVDSKDERI